MKSRWRSRVLSSSAIAATLGLMLGSSAVFAAGSGYAPTGGPGVIHVPGGFSSVITAVSVPPNKLVNIHVTVLNAGVGIIVSPGTFFNPVTMVVTAPNFPSVAPGGAPAGLLNFYPVAGLGLGFQINATQTITPKGPVTVTLQNPAIGPGDEVVEYTAQHRWVVQQHVLRLRAGLITFYFTGDPDVAVVAPVTQFGYHVYGVKPAVQANGTVQWTPEKPVGPVTYRNLGTDPLNTKDWLIAKMSQTAFGRHLTSPMPWTIYPQPKVQSKVGTVHSLPTKRT